MARCSLFALVLVWVLTSAAAQAKIFNPTTFRLANGLEVVVIPNHRVPVVTHMLWYKVGAADEPRGKSGIAHFLEHLMFKGTPRTPEGVFSARVRRVGGSENAFTSLDYTAYHQTVDPAHLAMVMELEADRLRGIALTDAQVAAEREVILEERRGRYDTRPSGLFREQIAAATYLAYPYRIPVIGWAAEMKGLSRQDALDFFDTWYAPNNAILVVAGDVTAARVKTLVEKFYGPVPARPVPDRTVIRGVEPPQLAPRRVAMTHERVRRARWSRIYLAPSHRYGRAEDVYALEVLAEILGGGPTSRLYRRLVVDNKIAIAAGAYYSGDNFGPGQFGFYGRPHPGSDLAALEAAFDAEITTVLRDGVTPAEVAVAQKKMRAEAILARDKVTFPALYFGTALATGMTVAEAEAWPERIAAVDAAAILRAAQSLFDARRSTTATLAPKEANQ
ncbi:MAG: pitrilysin family protein [Pseudomonadota bacterium]|nr:pitrilysin family protein [Pseudomonadota bacterium]